MYVFENDKASVKIGTRYKKHAAIGDSDGTLLDAMVVVAPIFQKIKEVRWLRYLQDTQPFFLY